MSEQEKELDAPDLAQKIPVGHWSAGGGDFVLQRPSFALSRLVAGAKEIRTAGPSREDVV
jgi:hypothetical protein